MRTFYLIKEGFRNMWANRLMAMAAIGVLVCCLLLTGFAYLAFASSDDMVADLREQNTVVVFMDEDQTDQQVAAMQTRLEGMQHISEVVLHSQEEQLKDFGGTIAEQTLESYEEENPLLDAFEVHLKDEAIEDMKIYNAVLEEMENLEGVESVSYDGGIAEITSQLGKVITAIGAIVVVVLLVVSLFIIVNTIKLTVYNRRLEIYIMKSVGATDNFIRFPFVVEGWLMGLVAGSISYGLMSLMYKTLFDSFNTLNHEILSLAPFDEHWLVLLIGFLGGGMLVGVIGSAISIRKHLHQEGGLRQ